jgi:tetratricopeptide (TPR) repeat protein
MQLPSDRESLLRLAAETERDLAEIAAAGDPRLAGRRAVTLHRLGGIRARLGEWEKAERLYDEAANTFWELGSPSERQFAAAERLSQSNMAMADGRYEQALEIIERLIEQFGGFPKLEGIPAQPAVGLRLWLTLLEKLGDSERLYEATGVALALLDPGGSTAERGVLAMALAQRAGSADELGYTDEALELYEQAITSLEGVDQAGASEHLYHAILRVATLLGELDRTEEANAAFARIIERFNGNKGLQARAAVAVARAWLEAYKD